MTDNEWRLHLIGAAAVPDGRVAYQGVIKGPARSGALRDLEDRPVVWQCHHHHQLARTAVECAARAARGWTNATNTVELP